VVDPFLLHELTAHNGRVEWVGWSPDGTRLATACHWTVRVWDAVSGAELATLIGDHYNWVVSVGWSPDGTRLATASHDQTGGVWDAETGDEHDTKTRHTHQQI
jgi:WD40 repeat protein